MSVLLNALAVEVELTGGCYCDEDIAQAKGYQVCTRCLKQFPYCAACSSEEGSVYHEDPCGAFRPWRFGGGVIHTMYDPLFHQTQWIPNVPTDI